MLSVRGLSKRFGARQVLDGVHLDVRPGEIVSLVGENGAGKTTLVRCIAGALSPDTGHIDVGSDGRVAVVWQDLALCDNLDAVANVFLGAERKRFVLDDVTMRREARRLFDEIGANVPDLHSPVGLLSGGQRQMVAIARALHADSTVLVLDEPAAALGVSETVALEELLRRLRDRGIAVLMVSHRIEQVFALADRIAVMRHGEIVADVSPMEVHPDDVVAVMAGAPVDSTARRQLRQLRHLIDELAEVEPAASLPLILTSLHRSLSVEAVGLWRDDGADRLRLRADVGLRPTARRRLEIVPAGEDGGVIGSAASGVPSVLDDANDDPVLDGLAGSAWAVPVLGGDGVLGVLAGFASRIGQPAPEQLELVVLHANLASASIEREALVHELTRRNRLLESLRDLLDRLAGPEAVGAGVGIALLPLRAAVEADALAMYEEHDGELVHRATVTPAGERAEGPTPAVAGAAAGASLVTILQHRTQVIDDGLVAVVIASGERRALLVAHWHDPVRMTGEALDLLEDASRSLALALEREKAELAVQESLALRQANGIQREFLYRLSHELRTPLTAIRGYADTLRQPDIAWDDAASQQFLGRISSESARMGRLVADLLDTSALETGGLRLQADWCDVRLVVEQAIACVFSPGEPVSTSFATGLPVVWADHDRIEQVLVNLLENACRHGAPPIGVDVRTDGAGGRVVIEVRDHGDGFADDVATRAFEAHARAGKAAGAGLGLTIARGIAVAHGGDLTFGHADGATTVTLTLPVEPPVGALAEALA